MTLKSGLGVIQVIQVIECGISR